MANILDCPETLEAVYPLSAEAGVSEYWLEEPLARQITIHRAPTSLDYAEKITLSGEALAQSMVLPGFQVSLASLFA